MAGLAADQGTQRKRVFKACDSCRVMKSKCDGARPACARCLGYGYKCVYAVTGKRKERHRFNGESVSAPICADRVCCVPSTALQTAVNEYDRLVREILPRLPIPEQPAVEDALQRTTDQVRQARLDAPACHDCAQSQARAPQQKPLPQPGRAAAHHPATSPEHTSVNRASAPRPAERYLGEVSDVRFFNLVDRALADTSNQGTPARPGSLADNPMQGPASDGDEEALASYEQDDFSPESTAVQTDVPADLPDPATAQRYLDIYFSTIHVAYPFLPRALFMQTYHAYIASDRQSVPHDTWLATLYILLAIGASYHAASGDAAATQDNGGVGHQQYYRKAMSLVNGVETLDRSLNQVSFLLAQCFYLLAVCRTDTCWTTLGLAVRIAQSIGLHVDADTARSRSRPKSRQVQMLAFCNAELRRRVWYSIYVLDRLLALQLGRPPAIHDEDSHLRLPSRLGDEDIQWLGGADLSKSDNSSGPAQRPSDPAAPTVGDYFLCMISLSRIIGHVLRDLYSPRGNRDATGEDDKNGKDDTVDTLTDWLLPSTKTLDRQLLAWRRALPRKLRFDFGHALDNTTVSSSAVIFKRQRNMLAIKFHHLRAVIHRPYLCLPLLWRLREDSSGDEAGGAARPAHNDSLRHNKIVGRYERICILEAQATAHLLHNVVDKQNLVHDFPWWQMISCLVYASSILVVASAFVARHQPGGEAATVPAAAGNPDNTADGTDSDGDDSDTIDATALEDDAETCLTVFEALSLNSDSARLARNMMRRLKARGAAWRKAHANQKAVVPVPIAAAPLVHAVGMPTLPDRDTGHARQADPSLLLPYAGQRIEPSGNMFFANAQPAQLGDYGAMPMQTDTPVAWPILQEWPLEILDSMEWSTQFFTADGNL
ncbi:hypothetical protein SEPCBS119000_003766 [Sporothrix epigloea]|uniref:Zn(2)-C6 fungal-type domain-containing protein n=1 Tax=Sporothrix epigloea TaxID=1892477 RepID=A0ABP0DPQ2_9PEZI